MPESHSFVSGGAKPPSFTPRPAHPTDSLPLPMTQAEMHSRGWDYIDILLVSGDAYIDHPSFGVALLGRWLLAHGFQVGVVAQPKWEDKQAALEQLQSMGRPRLFAGVTAGAIDSMLAHYTAFRKKRSDDAYSPGGKAGLRPNRASIVYTGLVKQAFAGLPVVLGGIEASLRRTSHYDFWADALRRSILLDSKADMLVYGMGEKAILAMAQIAQTLPASEAERFQFVEACKELDGVAYIASKEQAANLLANGQGKELPEHQEILANPAKLMLATLALEDHVHNAGAKLLQKTDERFVVINPPMQNLSTEEMDRLYALPFSRQPHAAYTEAVPAWEMIRTSITTHRGCGGGCSFCSLALHQSRRIAGRSKNSILDEARKIAAAPFKWAGSISDVGGPTANMWGAKCTMQDKKCVRKSCLHPKICPFFETRQKEGVAMLRSISSLAGVRNVRVASGVRFDLALQDAEALLAYTAEFTGGQLKVAPEHSQDKVLNLMRKPSLEVFERFLGDFFKHSQNAGKEQYTVPYLLSAFPGCTLEDMQALARWLAKKNWQPKQIQCFIPTPGTVATAMYYAGIDHEGNQIYVARTDKERMEQHHVLISPKERGEHAGKKRFSGKYARTALKDGKDYKAAQSDNAGKYKKEDPSKNNKPLHKRSSAEGQHEQSRFKNDRPFGIQKRPSRKKH